MGAGTEPDQSWQAAPGMASVSIDMPVCERHGIYHTEQQQCGICWREDQRERRSAPARTANKNKLWNSSLAMYSRKIKKIWSNGSGKIECVTCGKIMPEKGGSVVTSPHCGHYFPKGVYWGLAFDERNAAPQCYSCNVWNQGVIPAMRRALVARWGAEAIAELEAYAETWLREKKCGIHPQRPPDMWILGCSEAMKKKNNTKAGLRITKVQTSTEDE